MTRRQLLPLVALILLSAIASYLLQNTRPLGRNAAESASAARILEDQGSPETVRGNGNLTVVMFTDYQCSACRKADPALRRAVARDGNVRVVYKDWPILGERSERAATVALAAHRQGIYPSVHRQLMKSPSLDDTALRNAVEGAGGDWEQVEADLLTHGPAIANQLAANRLDAFALVLQGTPSYLIGPLLVEGALTEREFLRAFEQARSDT
ncbi:DsbA family protein [Altericroceibacterium xinjiangense]|uniref:DsbA family protein n=1 Tax=Altericroceibacterium xinjiangense TaxID=762261 RepID=UPI000F7F731E